MKMRVRFAILAVLALAVLVASVWQYHFNRRINPDIFDQIHDGMHDADVIALLGEPLPAKYDAGGNPVPVGRSWGLGISCGSSRRKRRALTARHC
jgi:hypothetical protein